MQPHPRGDHPHAAWLPHTSLAPSRSQLSSQSQGTIPSLPSHNALLLFTSIHLTWAMWRATSQFPLPYPPPGTFFFRWGIPSFPLGNNHIFPAVSRQKRYLSLASLWLCPLTRWVLCHLLLRVPKTDRWPCKPGWSRCSVEGQAEEQQGKDGGSGSQFGTLVQQHWCQHNLTLSQGHILQL